MKCDLKKSFTLIVVFSLSCIATSFVTDGLCFNVIYDATVGLYYLSSATIQEVLVPLRQNQGCSLCVTSLCIVLNPTFYYNFL